jgi:hypothetical protein
MSCEPINLGRKRKSFENASTIVSSAAERVDISKVPAVFPASGPLMLI